MGPASNRDIKPIVAHDRKIHRARSRDSRMLPVEGPGGPDTRSIDEEVVVFGAAQEAGVFEFLPGHATVRAAGDGGVGDLGLGLEELVEQFVDGDVRLLDVAGLDVGESLWPGGQCTAVLVGEPGGLVTDLEVGEDVVHFLPLLPMTANEAAWKRVHGAAALEELESS